MYPVCVWFCPINYHKIIVTSNTYQFNCNQTIMYMARNDNYSAVDDYMWVLR